MSELSDEELWSLFDEGGQGLEDHLARHPEDRPRIEELRNLTERISRMAPRPVPTVPGYAIKRLIGKGGQGLVYEAEQETPQRLVALKVLMSGRFDEDALKRFRREVRVHAPLRHPSIAPIYDAGWTKEGLPYFTMELVEGEPLDEHVRTRHLPMRARLALFLKVCDGVNYAHQNVRVHRDLKPPNILIDQAGVPKILDFGLAQLIDPDATVLTGATETGVGTPPYVSPEQARGERVTVRSDVYSLGVILYQLLTDRLPHDYRTLGEAASDSDKQAVPRPSAIKRALARDLDKITSRALANEPSQRYESALDLAGDVERYLRHQPVLAHPPSAIYRLRKFARRNSAAVAGASVAILGLVLGSSAATWQAIRATHQRDSAVAAERETEMVTNFLLHDMLGAADPYQARGADVSVREVLDEASVRIRGEFADQPYLAAAFHDTIGNAYLSLGLYDDAELHLRNALEIHREALPEDATKFAATVASLVQLLGEKANYEEAENVCRRALEQLQAYFGAKHVAVADCRATLAALLDRMSDADAAEAEWGGVLDVRRALLGSEHVDVARARRELAWVLQGKGQHAEAGRLYRQAVNMLRKLLGDKDPETLAALSDFAWLLEIQGQYEEAERLCREVLSTRRQLFKERQHPLVADSLVQLAGLLRKTGHHHAAQELLSEALQIRRKLMGTEHLSVANTLTELGGLLMQSRNYEAARPLLDEALRIRRKHLGDDHWLVADSLEALARLLQELGDYAAAEALAREALDIRRRQLGDDHWQVAQGLTSLAWLLHAKGDDAEAEARLREALAMYRRLFDPQHPRVADAVSNLGLLLYDLERCAEAEPLLRDALALRRELFGNEHPKVAESLNNLGNLLRDTGNYAEAESLLREALALYRKLVGPECLEVGYILGDLAGTLMKKGDPAAAEPLLREALEIRRKVLDPGHWAIASAESVLGECLTALRRYEDAEPLLLQSYAALKNESGESGRRTLKALRRIVELYEAWERPDAAAQYRERFP